MKTILILLIALHLQACSKDKATLLLTENQTETQNQSKNEENKGQEPIPEKVSDGAGSTSTSENSTPEVILSTLKLEISSFGFNTLNSFLKTVSISDMAIKKMILKDRSNILLLTTSQNSKSRFLFSLKTDFGGFSDNFCTETGAVNCHNTMNDGSGYGYFQEQITSGNINELTNNISLINNNIFINSKQSFNDGATPITTYSNLSLNINGTYNGLYFGYPTFRFASKGEVIQDKDDTITTLVQDNGYAYLCNHKRFNKNISTCIQIDSTPLEISSHQFTDNLYITANNYSSNESYVLTNISGLSKTLLSNKKTFSDSILVTDKKVIVGGHYFDNKTNFAKPILYCFDKNLKEKLFAGFDTHLMAGTHKLVKIMSVKNRILGVFTTDTAIEKDAIKWQISVGQINTTSGEVTELTRALGFAEFSDAIANDDNLFLLYKKNGTDIIEKYNISE